MAFKRRCGQDLTPEGARVYIRDLVRAPHRSESTDAPLLGAIPSVTSHSVWDMAGQVKLTSYASYRYQKGRMGSNGTVSFDTELVASVLDGERIYLPASFARQAGLRGDHSIDCWLLVVSSGRYRLLVKTAVSDSKDFARILQRVERVVEAGDVLDGTGTNSQPALRARLISCPASPRKSGWRVSLPTAALDLVPENEDRSRVFLLVVAGFVELWFPDTLRKALTEPISGLLH